MESSPLVFFLHIPGSLCLFSEPADASSEDLGGSSSSYYGLDWAAGGGDAAALPAATFTGAEDKSGLVSTTGRRRGGRGGGAGRGRKQDRVSPHVVLGE